MASNYPSGLDTFNTGHQDSVGEIVHASDVNNLADAVNKVEAELGTNPKGSFASVSAKLGALFYGQVTTTQRDALAQGNRPTGLIVFNTTTNRYEFNAGSQTTPNWQPVGPAGPWGTADIIDAAITDIKIANVAPSKINGYPSDGTKVLRGDGTWATPTPNALTIINDYIVSGSVASSYDTQTRLGGNIPQTYKDLLLVITAQSDQATAQTVNMIVNADAVSSHYWSDTFQVSASGNSNAENAGTTGSLRVGTIARNNGNGGAIEFRFFDYATPKANHGYMSDYSYLDNNASGAVLRGIVGGMYAPGVSHTITRFIVTTGGNFQVGARFTLYGRG